jgi:hypothetical protein
LTEFEKLLITHLRQHHAGLLLEFSAGHWDEGLERELKQTLTKFLSRLYEIGFLQEEEEIEI